MSSINLLWVSIDFFNIGLTISGYAPRQWSYLSRNRFWARFHITLYMGGSRGRVQGVRTPPFRKGTHSLHKTKKFPKKKTLLFCNYRKDVEYYTQMPGKHIHVLALEFSNFSGEGPRSPCVPFFRGCTPPPPRSRNPGSAPDITLQSQGMQGSSTNWFWAIFHNGLTSQGMPSKRDFRVQRPPDAPDAPVTDSGPVSLHRSFKAWRNFY
jgi:hypothetical protein